MGDLEERSSLPDSREEMMGHRRRPRHHRPQHGTAMSNSMIRRYTSAPSLHALDSRAGLQSLPFPDEFSMAASDDEVLEAMVEDQRTVVDRYSLESSIPQPRPPLSPLGRPEHSPASSPAVIRRDRRKKRMAPPPPTITAGRGGSLSPNASQRPLSDTVRLSVTNTSIDSAGSDVTDHSPLGETRSLGDSTGHSEPDLLRIGDASPQSSPKDMSRLEWIKFALKSPRNLRKNSKKWKDEPARWREDPDTWFRSKKNGVTLPPEFSVVTFGIIADVLEEDTEFEVQRLPEYDAFLSGLLEEVDSLHPDYADLTKAARRVQDMVREREDELRDAENDARMEAIQERFPNDDLQLRTQKSKSLPARRKSAPSAVIFRSLGSTKAKHNPALWSQYNTINRRDGEPQRSYIMEGPVQFSAGMQTQDRYLFLFSDLLLVAKQKSATQYKLKNRVPVSDLWLASCVEDVSEASRPLDKSFVLGWPTTNVVATFRDAEIKELWLRRLEERIEAEKSRDDHKTVSMKVVTRDIGSKTIEQPFPSCEVQITSKTEARDVLKVCLEQLQISESDARDYQLWVRAGKEGTPYPLIGHELPYAIKASYARELRAGDDFVSDSALDSAPANMKCEFILKPKKSSKKHSIEEGVGKRGRERGRDKKKVPLFNFLRRGKNDDKASVSVPAPTGKLFGHPLSDVCRERDLPPKPIMDLLGIIFREGPYTMGILRKSANARMGREVRARLDNGEELNLEDKDTVLAGALLKEYLRAIPRGLLLVDLYDDWMATKDMAYDERLARSKKLLGELPSTHLTLLRYVACALYQIQQHEDINKMGALNLSLCIAPSLLWGRSETVKPEAGPVVQFLLENMTQLLGDDVPSLLGEPVEHKLRQDSGTDTDSLHSVLSMHDTSNGMRRDDSSVDSLVDRDLYSGEHEHSPQLVKSHLSPSNLSRDSGLTLSDTQLYEDEGSVSGVLETTSAKYARSASHYMERDLDHPDGDPYSRSLEGRIMGPLHHHHHHQSQSQPQHLHLIGGDADKQPVPPPRKNKRRGFVEVSHSIPDQYRSSSMDTGSNKSMSQSRSGNMDSIRQTQSHPPFGARVSGESLSSVEERQEESVEMVKFRRPLDMGLLVKSASGGHLVMSEEVVARTESQARNMRERFQRQASLTSTPPLSPQYTSCSSSRDSVLSHSSMTDSLSSYYQPYYRSTSDSVTHSAPQTPESAEDKPLPWLPDSDSRERSMSDVNYRLHASLNLATEKPQSPSRLSASYGGSQRSLQNVQYLVSPPGSPPHHRREILSRRPDRRSLPVQLEPEHSALGRDIPRSQDKEENADAALLGASPKISITYCSSSSEERLEERGDKAGDESSTLEPSSSPQAPSFPQGRSQPLDMPQKREITLLTKSIGQGSPPPRVLLSGLRHTPRKEHAPLRASHDDELLMQVQRGGTDSRDFSPTELTGPRPSSASENVSRPRFSLYQQQSSPPSYGAGSRLAMSMQDLSSSDSASPRPNAGSPGRPERPPAYQDAVHRQSLLKAGIPLDLSDHETAIQKGRSRRAKELYEESLQAYRQMHYEQRHCKTKSVMDVSRAGHDVTFSLPSDVSASSNDVSFATSMSSTTSVSPSASMAAVNSRAMERARARLNVGEAVGRALSEELNSPQQQLPPQQQQQDEEEEEEEEVVIEEEYYVTLTPQSLMQYQRVDPNNVFDDSMKRFEREAVQTRQTSSHSPSSSSTSSSAASEQSRALSSRLTELGRRFRLDITQPSSNTPAPLQSPRKSSDPTRLALPSPSGLHRSLSDSSEHLNKLGSRTRGGAAASGQGRSLPPYRERSDSSPSRHSPCTQASFFYHPSEETRRPAGQGVSSSTPSPSPLQSATTTVVTITQQTVSTDSMKSSNSSSGISAEKVSSRLVAGAARLRERGAYTARDSDRDSRSADRTRVGTSVERGQAARAASTSGVRDPLSKPLDISLQSRGRDTVPDRTSEARQTERSSEKARTLERQTASSSADRGSVEREEAASRKTSGALPWSVATLKQLYDPRKGDVEQSAEAARPSQPSTVRGNPPPYVNPPPFRRLQDESRVSISSSSSAGSSNSGLGGRTSPTSSSTPSSSRRGVGRLGPQCAVDWHSSSSFSSSSEDLHELHRYGGRARSESSGVMSDPESLSFTDVSYV